jgi:hypothetical protein
MDFFIRRNSVATAVEVKSSQNRKSKSMRSLMSERWRVEQGIKLSADNVGQIENMTTYPLYMAMFL